MSKRNPNCKLCPLHESAANVCLYGERAPDPGYKAPVDVVFIGEAPGEKEASTGRPFMGPSGQLLRSEVAKAGIDHYYITNVAKCRPPKNRTPTPQEAKACRVYLDDELATLKPKYVVALGALASKTVLGKAKITQAHGQVIEKNGFIGMPIYHPAYALRDPSKLVPLQQDLAKLKRLMEGVVVKDDFKFTVVDSGRKLDEFLSEFKKADEFSFDTETSGLFPHDRLGRVNCLGIGLLQRSWVFPLGSRPFVRPLGRILREFSHGKLVIAQNGKFDNEWMHYYLGTRFYLGFDTMLAHHILDENQDHDLKYMARVELDCPEYDLTAKEKRGDVMPMRLYEYCGRDAWNTLRLKQRFEQRLRRELPLRRLFYKLVMPAVRALEDVELEGITLDMPQYEKTEKQVRKDYAEALSKLNEMAGKAINWNSPAQVSKLLYGKLGLSTKVKTGTGKPSTGEAALVGLRGKHPVVEQLFRYRELGKFLSTYLEGWKEYTVDGRLYVSYKVHGTVTGRFSSRLHQIPRDGTIRNLAIAPPGWRFVQADLSQAELRIAAELSRDLELVSCFRTGGTDVHWKTLLRMIGSGKAKEYTEPARDTALQLLLRKPGLTEAIEILQRYGHEACISIDKGWKEARKKAKAINFGFVFGMYENKFIEQAKTKYDWDCTWEEAHEFREAYFELYPGLKPWHDKQKALVRMNGYVTNLFGRKRRLPGIYSSDRELRSECERQAINSPVQGAIGDWKAAALVEIAETFSRDALRIVGEHHDALLMIVREGCEDTVLPRVRKIMCKPKLLETFKVNMSVPMEVEISVGPWGMGETYKEDLQ